MPLAEAVDLDQALDEVFATPPEEFVAARDALVKRLRAEKRRDEAAAVAGLRRPNRIVWALDQLALVDDPSLAALLDAVAAVQTGDDLRTAVSELREAVSEAAGAAAARLDLSRPTDRADLAAALHTVVGDAAATEELRSGRLLELPTASPFGFAPAAPAATPAAKKPAKKAATAKAPAKKAAAKPTPKRPDPLAVRRAQKTERAAAKTADAAQRALAVAEDAAEAAEDDLEAADEALARATSEHERAVAAHAAAQSTRFEAAEAAARADDALAAAQAELADLT